MSLSKRLFNGLRQRQFGFLSVIALVVVAPLASAAVLTCDEQNLAAFRSHTLIQNVVKDSKLYSLDCLSTGEHDIVLFTVNAKSGLVTHLASFPHKGVKPTSHPEFVSPVLGLDSFPLTIEGKARLMVLIMSAETSVYINPQTGPSATKFSRWVISFKDKTFTEDKTKSSMFDAGHPPVLKRVNGRLKADVHGKIVDLN